MNLTPLQIYTLLFTHFGPQHWWPIDGKYHEKHLSDPRFEIIIGAILTQNTAWSNVEKALMNLKKQHLLCIKQINKASLNTIKKLIRPSGFFNQKAERLQIMSQFLQDTPHGNLDELFSHSLKNLRTILLQLKGIGPETADSILLYAGNKPIFVVDAYTKRLCQRLQLPVTHDSYAAIQSYFQDALIYSISSEEIVQVYKEFHALIVEWAKQYCHKRKPLCTQCPLAIHCTSTDKQSE